MALMVTRHQRRRRAVIGQLAITGILAVLLLTPRVDIGTDATTDLKMIAAAPNLGLSQPIFSNREAVR
jgi:hypothetical protein